MVIIGQAARLVVALALLWSAGCAVAAVNWHSNWSGFVQAGTSDGVMALQAQERLWHWAELSVLGILVAVAALVAALRRTVPRDG